MRRIGMRIDSDDDGFEAGVQSVLFIRCMKHRNVPQLNSTEIHGGECGVCVERRADDYVGSALNFLVEGDEDEAKHVLRNWLERK